MRDRDEVYVQLASGKRLLRLVIRTVQGCALVPYNPAHAVSFVRHDEVEAMHVIVYCWRGRALSSTPEYEDTVDLRKPVALPLGGNDDWLYYFAAHRMHHDPTFAAFILSDRRYAAYPELIEFYAGIDRRRSDAVACMTTDLARMNSDFLTRTQIRQG